VTTDGRAYIPASKTVEHGTPDDLFEQLSEEFGPFDLDAAASDALHMVDTYFCAGGDGLRLPWFGRVWVNPPYGRGIRVWLEKALAELAAGRCSRVVFLVPAATSTSWWHDLVIPRAAVVRFLRGRLTFKGSRSCAPFASAVVVFERKT
jgi:site-specific DNA-methyltransferase (adenine-specific)